MAKKDDNQLELFAPMFPSSIAVKDQQDLMQYPFFSLSKSKRTTPIDFDNGKVQITVTSSDRYGIASIFDADILIYIASQLMEAHNKGLPTSRVIKVSKYDILEFVGKATGGKSYIQLKNALRRLKATMVETTIRPEDGSKGDRVFGWIEDFTAIEKNGRPVALSITIPQWFYNGVVDRQLVLTMNRKYFEIEGGLERFLYRIARKVAGTSNELKMKLDTVRKRSGTTRKPGAFRKLVENIMIKQSLPEYWIFLVKRQATGDEYVVANQKARFRTYEEAYANISFIAMDKALILASRRKRR